MDWLRGTSAAERARREAEVRRRERDHLRVRVDNLERELALITHQPRHGDRRGDDAQR